MSGAKHPWSTEGIDQSEKPGAPAHYREALRRLGDRFKREALRRLLPPRLSRLRDPYFVRKAHPSSREVQERLAQANILGIGFGLKESSGSFTGTFAVRVYVAKKVAKKRLARNTFIPPEIAGCPTDIVPVGRLRWQARPVPVGSGISARDGRPGSIGCLVAKADPSRRYVLSAAHVLAFAGGGGEIILEPPQGQAGSARLGMLTDFEPLLDDGTANLMDAGIALLDNPADVSLAPGPIGRLDPMPLEPALYQSVRKFGAATGHTLGIVSDTQADVTMNGSVRYHDVFEILGCEVPFSKGGDSGALVVDALTNRPVGLIVGGNGGYRTYAAPIGRALSRFRVTVLA